MEEIRDQLIRSFEQTGVIDSLKAKIRSEAIKYMEGQSIRTKAQTGYDPEHPMAKQLSDNPDCFVCLSLIREFLEFYKFEYTLNVFLPEAA